MLMRHFIVFILLVFSLPSACLFLSSTSTYASLNEQYRIASLSEDEEKQKTLSLQFARMALEKVEGEPLEIEQKEKLLDKATATLKPFSPSDHSELLLWSDLHYNRWSLYINPSVQKFSRETLSNLYNHLTLNKHFLLGMARALAGSEHFLTLALAQVSDCKTEQKLKRTKRVANLLFSYAHQAPALQAIDMAKVYATLGLHDRAYAFLEDMASQPNFKGANLLLAQLHLTGTGEPYDYHFLTCKRQTRFVCGGQVFARCGLLQGEICY